MLEVLGQRVYLVAYAPVHTLDLGPRLQVYHAVREQLECLFAYLLCVVPVLEHRARVEVVPYIVELLYQFVVALGRFKLLGHLRQRCCFEHVDNQDGVVCGERASAFGNQVGVGDVVFVGSLDELVYAVIHVFLQ